MVALSSTTVVTGRGGVGSLAVEVMAGALGVDIVGRSGSEGRAGV
jgi:hypothetical protein